MRLDVWTNKLQDGSTDLNLLLGRKAPFLDVACQAADGIVGLTHALDFITATVGCAGVRHATYHVR